MSIEIRSEQLIPLQQLPSALPRNPTTGRKVHMATIWRWVQRGCRGVRLETVLVGGVRYTSEEALQRFVERTTASADGTLPTSSTPSTRRRAHERACSELDGAGI